MHKNLHVFFKKCKNWHYLVSLPTSFGDFGLSPSSRQKLHSAENSCPRVLARLPLTVLNCFGMVSAPNTIPIQSSYSAGYGCVGSAHGGGTAVCGNRPRSAHFCFASQEQLGRAVGPSSGISMAAVIVLTPAEGLARRSVPNENVWFVAFRFRWCQLQFEAALRPSGLVAVTQPRDILMKRRQLGPSSFIQAIMEA